MHPKTSWSTKTLVKNCMMLIDNTPYKQQYESHYALPLDHKKGQADSQEGRFLNKKLSKKIQKKYGERKETAKISSLL